MTIFLIEGTIEGRPGKKYSKIQAKFHGQHLKYSICNRQYSFSCLLAGIDRLFVRWLSLWGAIISECGGRKDNETGIIRLLNLADGIRVEIGQSLLQVFILLSKTSCL